MADNKLFMGFKSIEELAQSIVSQYEDVTKGYESIQDELWNLSMLASLHSPNHNFKLKQSAKPSVLLKNLNSFKDCLVQVLCSALEGRIELHKCMVAISEHTTVLHDYVIEALDILLNGSKEEIEITLGTPIENLLTTMEKCVNVALDADRKLRFARDIYNEFVEACFYTKLDLEERKKIFNTMKAKDERAKNWQVKLTQESMEQLQRGDFDEFEESRLLLASITIENHSDQVQEFEAMFANIHSLLSEEALFGVSHWHIVLFLGQIHTLVQVTSTHTKYFVNTAKNIGKMCAKGCLLRSSIGHQEMAFGLLTQVFQLGLVVASYVEVSAHTLGKVTKLQEQIKSDQPLGELLKHVDIDNSKIVIKKQKQSMLDLTKKVELEISQYWKGI